MCWIDRKKGKKSIFYFAAININTIKYKQKRDKTNTNNTNNMSSPAKLTLERPATPISSLLREPNADLPLAMGESIHMGYRPITEEIAFQNPFVVRPTTIGFDWLRHELSCDMAISFIRKFVWANDAYFLVPKSTDEKPRELIYEAWVTHRDKYNRTIRVELALKAFKPSSKRDMAADGSEERIFLSVVLSGGEYTLFNKFYSALKCYVESRGTADPQIHYRDQKSAKLHPAKNYLFPQISPSNTYVSGNINEKNESSSYIADFESWPVIMPTDTYNGGSKLQ